MYTNLTMDPLGSAKLGWTGYEHSDKNKKFLQEEKIKSVIANIIFSHHLKNVCQVLEENRQVL